MGRGIAKHFVGLWDHTAESNERNALCFGFRIRSCNTAGGWFTPIRTETYDIRHNEEVLARNLDLADERRENAIIRMADYQKQLSKMYTPKVQHKQFSI